MELIKKTFKDIHEFGWYIFGCVLAAAMIVPLLMYPGGKKHLLLGAALAGCSAFLTFLKKFPLKLSVVLLVGYLIYVPAKIFDRMELPIHDMNNIYPLAKIVTVGIIILLYVFFFLLTQQISAGIVIGNVMLLFVTVVEFYLYKFRGSVFGPADILATKTAMMVMGNYDYTPSHEIVYSVVWFVFFIVLACKINVTAKEIKKSYPGYPAVRVHIVASALALVVLLVSGVVLFKTDTLDRHGINSGNALYVPVNEAMGCVLYPVCEYNKTHMKMPAGYSMEKILEIGRKAEDEFEPLRGDASAVKPNVILIMNESFSDLRVLGDFEATEDELSFWNSVCESDSAVSGYLHMPVFGGLTVNSEFEALTGSSMYYFTASSIPYQTMFEESMPSLVTDFEGAGYKTAAIHPNLKSAYDRENVYDKLGFDEFYGLEDFAVPIDSFGSFTTDSCNYKEIINVYENRDKSAPFFCFDVTIQNHGGYSGKYRKIKLTSVGGRALDEGEGYVGTDHYLSLMKDSDDAFRELIEYFESVDEPVIICMFGDHQPILQDVFYDRIFAGRDLDDVTKRQLKYITPYVIWANYDAGLEEVGDFSANYLGAVLLDELGLPMSQFRKFQRNLMKEIPIFSFNKVADATGRNLDAKEIDSSEAVAEYKILEYWQLFDHAEGVGAVFETK